MIERRERQKRERETEEKGRAKKKGKRVVRACTCVTNMQARGGWNTH